MVDLWGVPLDPTDAPADVRQRIKIRPQEDCSGLNVGQQLSVYFVRVYATLRMPRRNRPHDCVDAAAQEFGVSIGTGVQRVSRERH